MTNETFTTIYFIRHGQTVWNAEGRWQGWQDSPLTKKGEQQAAAAAEELVDLGITHIYASDAGRAKKTAEIIGDRLTLKPSLVSELRERFYGDFEGQTTQEISDQFPGTMFDESRDRRDTWRPPGGETLVEVGARVLTFIRQAAVKHPGGTIAAVTHAGVLRVLDGLSCGQPLDEIWDRVPPNCAIFGLKVNSAGNVNVARHFCLVPESEQS